MAGTVLEDAENGQTFDNMNKKDTAYAMDMEKNLFIFNITRAVDAKRDKKREAKRDQENKNGRKER